MMNSKNYLTTLLGVPALVLGSTLVLSQASLAQETQKIQVVCSVNGDIPTVVAKAPEGESSEDVAILKLLPQYFESPEMAKAACENAAKELQVLYNQNQANYLTADLVDEQPVVCAVGSRNSGCNGYDATFLFNFKSEEEPQVAYNNMLGDAYEVPVEQVRTIPRMYTDIKPMWWKIWPR